MTFLTLGHAANTKTGQTLHPSGNCGFCQNTEILMYRQRLCGAFAALEKRAKYAAAGSGEVSCKRRQLCLNMLKTFLLLVSQRLFKSCSLSRVSVSCPFG